MNVLIRDVNKETKWNEVILLIDLLTTDDRFIDELDKKRKLIFDDKRLKLTKPIIITKQPNGNLCVEFKEWDGYEK